MTTALAGHSIGWRESDRTRVPIKITPDARDLLVTLLHQPYMQGVGYSEFITRAVLRAEQEADEQGLL